MAPQRYWFKAKRYGWGWGLPATWEGWLVFGAYVAVAVLGGIWADGTRHEGAFLGVLVLLTAIFVLICLRTGEPPKWRWGDRR